MSISIDNDIKNALGTIVERTPDLGQQPNENFGPVQEPDHYWRPLLAVAAATVAVAGFGFIAANRTTPANIEATPASQPAAAEPGADAVSTTTVAQVDNQATFDDGIPTFDVTIDLAGTSYQIDRGHVDGIKVGMPVVDSKGLLGKITSVTDRTSEVLLITDPNFSANVEMSAFRSSLVATGTGEGELALRGNTTLTSDDVGEVIYTAGRESTLPSGVPIGTIKSVELGPNAGSGIVAIVTPLTTGDTGSRANVLLFNP